jgi:hypothetical protein
MQPFLLLSVLLVACGPLGLDPQVRDTGSALSFSGEAAAGCGWLEVGWTPPQSAVRTELLGELVDDQGVQVRIWDLLDDASGTDPVQAGWTACGLSFRGVGAADLDGDGAHDTWSSEVRGDACGLVGAFTCALDGQPFAPTTERREDGCSTWCVTEG